MRDDTHHRMPAAGREGFALAATVMAMVLIGALVTGGFYVANQEGQITRSVRHGAEALHIAEHGLNQLVGTWSVQRFDAVQHGQPVTETISMEVDGRTVGEAEVTVRRLGNETFFVASSGWVANRGRYSDGRRIVGMMVRVTSVEFESEQAVRVLGGLTLRGNAEVNGTDQVPEGWDTESCPAPQNTPAIITSSEAEVRTQGNPRIIGEPEAVVRDPTVNPDDFLIFGDMTYDDLAALATTVIPGNSGAISNTLPSLSPDGTCDTSDEFNWGAPKNPDHPCHEHFPIIHVKDGDLHLNGGASGQGILLVDGDMKLNGNYEFHGIVIVRGRWEQGGGSSKVFGTTLIYSNGNMLGTNSEVTGTPEINYSSCAVERAVRFNSALSRAIPIAERSWFDLSAMGAGG